MKYLIFGNGWIGNMLKEYLVDAEIWPGADINHFADPENKFKAQVYINTAAYTAIDWCEENKRETFESNVRGAWHLAKVAKENGIKYVFFSSSCIFNSQKIFTDRKEAMELAKFFTESDHPNPQCFYTETKVMAERLVLEENPNSLIVRPRFPISATPHPRNTLNKLLGYSKINDAQESITIIEDFIPKLIELMVENEKGCFNIVNKGTISPAELSDLMGHPYEKVSKEDQDERMKKEGKTQRVTCYVKSERTEDLPDVQIRAPQIIEEFNKKMHGKL